MNRASLLLVFSLVSAPLVHGQPSRAAVAASEEDCLLAGTVVRAADGQPLRRAHISARRIDAREQPRVAFTGTDGRFELRDLPPGSYRLSVDRNGFVRQEYGQRFPHRPGAELHLTPRQEKRDLIFRLLPAAVITGRVFDEAGEPLHRSMVSTLRYSYMRGHRQLVPVGSAQTNDLGEYRIYGLPPDRYYLVAAPALELNAPGQRGTPRPTGASREESYAPVFYPGVADPGQAVPIELHAGEELARMDLTIVPQRTVRVRGRVTGVWTGRLSAQVTLVPRQFFGRGFYGNYSFQTEVENLQGAFEIRGVPPGSYILTAMQVDENRSPASAREFLEVGATDVDGLNLSLTPGAEVIGRVRVEGAPEIRPGGWRVQLLPRDDLIASGSNSPVLPDGSFTVRNLPADIYRPLVVGAPEDFYLKSARVGPEDVLESGLSLGRGRAAATLELVVSPNGGRLDGQVLDAESLPVSGATVVLVPTPRLRNNSGLYKETTSDPSGRFELRGIAPGEYKLFAWEDVEIGAWYDSEFLAPFEERGLKVRVVEKVAETVKLNLIRGQ